MEEPAPGASLSYRSEVLRKAIHLLALVVPFGMAILGKHASLLLLVPLCALALGADFLRSRSVGFARFIRRIFGSLMRPEEQPAGGGPVVVNGATWVLLTAALLALLFPIRLAVPAFVMFMVGDAAAALIGRRWGRHAWGRGPRTVEGSLAFVAVGLSVMAFFTDIPFGIGAVSVACAALAEALPFPLNDNVRVPLIAAFVLWLFERVVLFGVIVLR